MDHHHVQVDQSVHHDVGSVDLFHGDHGLIGGLSQAHHDSGSLHSDHAGIAIGGCVKPPYADPSWPHTNPLPHPVPDHGPFGHYHPPPPTGDISSSGHNGLSTLAA